MGKNESGSSGRGMSVGVSVAFSGISEGSGVSDGIPLVTSVCIVAGGAVVDVDGKLQAKLTRIMVTRVAKRLSGCRGLGVGNRTWKGR